MSDIVEPVHRGVKEEDLTKMRWRTLLDIGENLYRRLGVASGSSESVSTVAKGGADDKFVPMNDKYHSLILILKLVDK